MLDKALVTDHAFVIISAVFISTDKSNFLPMDLTRLKIVILKRLIGNIGLKLKGGDFWLAAEHLKILLIQTVNDKWLLIIILRQYEAP